MKIREILSLTQEKRLSEIAKEHLNIGEKPTREALKRAGCYSISGKKGWFFDGNEEILDKEIYEFATVKDKANARTKDVKRESREEVKNEEMNKRKRASFDLDADLLKQLKIKAVVEEKNIYELVEQAIKEFLEK